MWIDVVENGIILNQFSCISLIWIDGAIWTMIVGDKFWITFLGTTLGALF